MNIWVLLTVSALVAADPNCNNPLFSTANWPTDMQRPRYLTTPQAFTANTTFCGKFMSGTATQTCCDQNAVDDIVTMFQSRRDQMKQKGEGLEGGVRDTFNDFDPANQKAKGVAVPTGSGRLLTTPPSAPSQPTGTGTTTGGQPGQSTSGSPPTGTSTPPAQGSTGSTPPPQGGSGTNPPPQGSSGTTTTGTQGGNPPPQGQNNSTNPMAGHPSMGPPPREDRPEGFNNFNVPDSNLTAPSPPKGRGTEKKRPGILKMSASAQEAIGNITRDMNALMQQFAHDMGKCMMAQLKHMAGMMCMGCDPSWESWVSGTSTSITVSLKDTACDELTSACLDFVKEAQNLPALVDQMKASIQTIIDSEIAAGTITAGDVPTDDLSGRTRPPAQVVPVCSTDADCRTYICETMSKGNAGVAPEPAAVADPAGISSKTRLLTASVTYQFTSGGYDSVSLGAVATASTPQTSTTGSFIDGVSTETSPLTTASGSVLALVFSTLVY